MQTHVAQRTNIVSRSSLLTVMTSRSPSRILLLQPTCKLPRSSTRIVVPAQERSPALEFLTQFDPESREEAVQSASSSSAGTDSSMDGKELGIELARVVNDVKVRIAP